MGGINDVLKKLNKSRDEGDKIALLKNMPEDFLEKGFISTSSPYLDYRCKGHSRTGMSLITGWESVAKSSLLLCAIKEAQNKFPDKTPVVFDGEGSINANYMTRMGVDMGNLIIIKEKRLETVLDQAEAFSKADDVSLIGFDSVKSFYSSIDEQKTAEEYSIGGTAKRWNTRMPIISSNCYRRGIPIILIHQWRKDPGAMYGDGKVLSGGLWIKYMPDFHVDITKKDLIRDERKNVIGHVMGVRIKKSKHTAYDPKDLFELNFYYDYGFNEVDEYASIFIEEGFIEQKGGWFYFDNGEKVQGKSSVIAFLKDNIEYFEVLKTRLT
jgi:recombination protein RecA